MTSDLERPLRIGAAPFAGSMLRAVDWPLGELRALLSAAADVLAHVGPLVAFDDWHEHDSFGDDGAPTTWAALRAKLVDDQALLAARHGDFDVYRAIHGPGFLLRFDADDEELCGTADLSASDLVLDAVLAHLPAALRARLHREPARAYFERVAAPG
jgi:hypothetical protein